MRFCPVCGTENEDSHNFCVKCRNKLPEVRQPPYEPSKSKRIIPAVIVIIVVVVISAIAVTLVRVSPKEYADVILWVENPKEISYNLTITIDERVTEGLVRRIEILGTNVYFRPFSRKRFDCTIDITSLKDYEINVAFSNNPGYLIAQKFVHLHEGYNEIEIEI